MPAPFLITYILLQGGLHSNVLSLLAQLETITLHRLGPIFFAQAQHALDVADGNVWGHHVEEWFAATFLKGSIDATLNATQARTIDLREGEFENI